MAKVIINMETAKLFQKKNRCVNIKKYFFAL